MNSKLAIVSGASGGIGREVVASLSHEEYHVIAIGRNLSRLKKSLDSQGGVSSDGVSYVESDLSKMQEIIKALSAFDLSAANEIVLVNSAGLSCEHKNFQDVSDEDFEEQLNSNLLSSLRLSKALLPYLVSVDSGYIFNIGSVAGRWSSPKNAIYNLSKSAILSFSESLRLDVMGTGVRVTNIEPGLVATEFSRQRFSTKTRAETFFRGIELLMPEDIAANLVWCLKQPARVNIQELVIFPTQQAGVGHLTRTTNKREM